MGEAVGRQFKIRQSSLTCRDKFAFNNVRFKNEAAFIHAQGGTLLRIVRPQHGASLAAAEASHRSENELTSNDWDACISNAGTILDLRREVLRVIARLPN